MRKILLALLLFAYTFCMAQTRILMEKQGGVYIVPCKVNGLPLNFIFDTGASDVSISLTEAIFMLKNGYLQKEDIGESVYFGIANGDVAKGTKLTIKEIEIGGLKLNNISASIVHESKAPLLLGQSVIEKLGTIQINKNELLILNGQNYDYDSYNLNIRDTNYSNLTNTSFVGAWKIISIRTINLPENAKLNNVFDLAEIDCLRDSTWNLKNGYKGNLNIQNNGCGRISEKIKWEINNGDFLFKYDKKNNSFGYKLKVTDANYNKFELTQTIPSRVGEIYVVYNFRRE